MLSFILAFALILAFVFFPQVRYTYFHFPRVFYNAVVDFYWYVKHKRWNEYRQFGRMFIYIANDKQPFGSGKTLSIVDYVRAVYNRYNNALVWSFSKNKFVPQQICIYSNVELFGIPYIPLVSYEQIIAVKNVTSDDMRVNLFVIDELGSQFNNRNWKNNLPADLLEAILQQRKSKVSILGTVQDWTLFDATLRKVSSECIECSKKWRFVLNKSYYARDMERAQNNSELIKVRGVRCFFATDKLYNSYNTNERVSKLVKAISAGEIISNEEILNCANGETSDLSVLTNIKRKYRKRIQR